MNKVVAGMALLGALSGCAGNYTAERAGVPYGVFRGFHLECVKQAQLHGDFKGKTDRNSFEQSQALLLGGLSGVGAIPALIAYNLAEPLPRHNAHYQQCMTENGVAPRQ
jgi:hypothetical protein